MAFIVDNAQEVNIQNMNVELVAQMFKNYQSNVLFHLEGMFPISINISNIKAKIHCSYRESERTLAARFYLRSPNLILRRDV